MKQVRKGDRLAVTVHRRNDPPKEMVGEVVWSDATSLEVSFPTLGRRVLSRLEASDPSWRVLPNRSDA